MSDLIAATTFETGPKDELAPVDVYTSTKATPQNLAPIVAETATVVGQELKTLTSPENLVNILVSARTSGLSVDGKVEKVYADLDAAKKASLDKIKAVTGKALSVVEDLKGQLLTDLLGATGFTGKPEELAKGLLGLPGSTDPINTLLGENPKLRVIYDAVSVVDDGDTNTATGIANILNSIAGNSELAKVLDMDSQFKVFQTILANVSFYNIPQIIDDVLGNLHDDEEKTKFLHFNIKSAVRRADLPLINKILDYVSRHAVLAEMPNAVSVILQNYRMPFGSLRDPVAVSSATNINTLRTTLVNTLVRIDPHWYQYNRNGTWIDNLEPFTYSNSDSKKVLSSDPYFKEIYMFAKAYPSRNLVALSRSFFPAAAL